MRHRNLNSLYAVLALLAASCGRQPETVCPADYVNPLMGTESVFEFSHGNTYPAVALPWGMNFWSPQTGENGSGWMYSYGDTQIRGFRQTHQPSPWINDYGTFSIMPISGELKVDHSERGASFSHENEKATPYSYSVVFDNGVRAEMVPTLRGAVLEFEFPSGNDNYVVVDAYKGGGSLSIDTQNNIVSGVSRYSNGGTPEGFANYFILQFSHPISAFGTYDGAEVSENMTEVTAENACAYLKFDIPEGESLTVKTASSFISAEQAAANFSREVKDIGLEAAKAAAKENWNDCLGRIEVEGGSLEHLRTFYSCLYRAVLFPRTFFEFDELGEPVYRSPYDGEVHDGYMYTDNGFWDTFRAVHPLFTLVYPKMSERITTALINAYQESGFLPEWMSPGHRGCMIGNNSISVLADAWLKGIRTIDAEQALEAMVHQTKARHGNIASVGRDGFEYYDSLGYVPYPEVAEATAKTLEYAYADWCLARFAESLGKDELAAEYYGKSMNYRNLYLPEQGFMWARDSKGNWRDNFDATEWGGPFTEGCSWHWTWSVMHDPEGLASLMGGHWPMAERLDSMFNAPNTYNYGTYGFVIHEIAEMVALDMGQYAHGNQPVQHAAYLYDYIGQPWKTQEHVREIMEKLYNCTSAGYCWDEDNGQTSAWYVFSAMGFYPVCPGTSEYALGSPLFEKVTIHLPGKKKFVIRAKGNSKDAPYIRSARLDGKPFGRNFLTHDELTGGGELVLEMSATPDTLRGTSSDSLPYSYS